VAHACSQSAAQSISVSQSGAHYDLLGTFGAAGLFAVFDVFAVFNVFDVFAVFAGYTECRRFGAREQRGVINSQGVHIVNSYRIIVFKC
jgi:hypothetical protein